ncbi:hypothetical protein [Robbsia sp. KACC 23696]|uniref:CAF17-like 4Fe-4S cluster assembly/insertion protein YgfZ n=1 Tax=Robbsia sp. KACC 23696 TaxID=3149231 RepID=UPI00325BE2B6
MSDTSEILSPSAAIDLASVDLVASPATLQAKAAQASRVVPPHGGFATLPTPGPWAVIDARGPEARSFLHNQLTNDVTHLPPSQAALGGFCSPKGRLLASMLYWPLAAPQLSAAASTAQAPHAVPVPTHHDDLAHWPDIRLLISADIAEAIRKRLHMFVLRTKVKLADHSHDVALFGLAARVDDPAFDTALAALLIERGIGSAPTADAAGVAVALESVTVPAGSASLVSLLAGTVAGDAQIAPALPLVRHDSADGNGVTLLRLADAAGQRRFLLCVPAAGRDSWLAALAGRFGALDPAHWNWLDIQAAAPRITAATQDAFVPQMINFEAIGGVNFRKGCYPGQEVVARSQYRGTVKRRATLAHAEQAAAGDEIIDLNDPANQGSAEQWQPCGRVVNAAPAPDGGVDCLIELKTATPSNAALRVVLRSAATDTPQHDVSATPVTATAALSVYGLPYTLPAA